MAPIFYYDLMSPYAYLAAERIDSVLTGAEWQPVLLGGLFGLAGRGSWALAGDESRARGIAECERRAEAYGLPPIRWPDPWPTSSLYAMRLAVYARRMGRERKYVAAAFRTAFGDGADLGERRHVLVAAEAAGINRAEAEAALGDQSVKDELRAVTDVAHARGVYGVPTIAVGDQVFWGDDRLEDAAAALSR